MISNTSGVAVLQSGTAQANSSMLSLPRANGAMAYGAPLTGAGKGPSAPSGVSGAASQSSR
eukprot:SAG31_NODE_2683_length_5256_cov_6.529184_3_plen_61_part_00